MEFKNINKYCINLPRRPDRLVSVMAQFHKHDLDVQAWAATDKNDLLLPPTCRKIDEFNVSGIYACLLSHVGLIKHCAKEGHKYVAIFEDDVVLCSDFWDRIKIIESMHDDWDMFYLGGHFETNAAIEKTSNKYIYKCHNMSGTYAYILKDTVYDFIIQNTSYNWGMDEFYDKLVLKKFTAMAFIPFLADHIDGTSDVVGRSCVYPLTHKNYRSKI